MGFLWYRRLAFLQHTASCEFCAVPAEMAGSITKVTTIHIGFHFYFVTMICIGVWVGEH